MYGYGQNAPQGLAPLSTITGATWNGQLTAYNIASGYATRIGWNDPVMIDSTNHLIQWSSGRMLGVFQGCRYLDAQGNLQFSKYWPENTLTFQGQDAVAYVIDDPNVVFDIQISTSTGAPGPVAAPFLVNNDIGFNAAPALTVNSFNPSGSTIYADNPGTANTISGLSGFYLDTATFATTATLPLKIIGLTPQPTNGFGSSYPFNNALVIINNHLYKGGTGQAGV